MDNKVIKNLTAILGKARILTAAEDLISYSYDATNQNLLPEAVVFPQNSDEISKILVLANENKIPVVPRGAGTGYSGGSLPFQGGIVLALSKMDKILEIDQENLTATVEPGVVTGKLQEEVESRGLFYPPDPSSLKTCTLGGNVAENSGGPRGLKYGVTKDYVLALEVVIPTGEILKLGAKTNKSVAGYNLADLMIGSEGTLGVITKVTIKLMPKPEGRYALFVLFDKLDNAALAVSKIIKEKIIPSALEFLDKNALSCVKDYLNMPLADNVQAMLLIEVDGDKILLDSQLKKISQVCLSCGAIKIEEAKTEEEIEKIWAARRSISPALSRLGPTKISEDIVVPRSKLKEMVLALDEIRNKYKINLVAFGHAGDGNIHVTIQTDKRKEEELRRVNEAVDEVMKTTLSLGGSISGEHGIGLTKKKFLPWEIGQNELNLMRRIKNTLDPNNILNPGKIF